MPILKVNNLTKTFCSGLWPFSTPTTYTAVNDISFQMQKGEILGFLGPNGAGKTTTIQMLLGTLTPSSGSITYFGTDFASHRIESLKRIGYASGYDRLPSQLTVVENLHIVGRIYGMSGIERTEQIEKLLNFFRMWDKRNNQMKSLSAGQTTRVLLAKAFLANPEIVLLDEPTASLDPDVAHEVRQFILAQRKERNISLLITSHNMDEVTELCDRVLVLKNGSIIANNTPVELAQSISKAHLHLNFAPAEFEKAISYLATRGTIYKIQGYEISIELDEHLIAQFLSDLAHANIIYSHISIDKPSLEDYFLSIAR